MSQFKIGDVVRERDGDETIGVVVHQMSFDRNLVVVRFPPAQNGHCYHVGDLVRVKGTVGRSGTAH